LNEVALSLPSVINRQGIAQTLDLTLSNEEEAALKRSAEIIRNAIQSLDLDDRISTGLIPSTRLFTKQNVTT
jgi:malate/lactate dehydrogenase